MNEYKHLTEMIPEMEPDEIFYKRIFLEYPAAHLDQAHTVEEIEKLCPEASSHAAAGFTYHPGNALDETILPSDEDTIIFRHNRYAPAFCIRTLFLR